MLLARIFNCPHTLISTAIFYIYSKEQNPAGGYCSAPFNSDTAVQERKLAELQQLNDAEKYIAQLRKVCAK